MAPWRADMQFAIQKLSTQVLNPVKDSNRAVKQMLRYLTGTHNTRLRLERHRLGRRLFSATKCYRHSLQCTRRHVVQQELETDGHQFHFL